MVQKWTISHRNFKALSAGSLVPGRRLRPCSQLMVNPLYFCKAKWVCSVFSFSYPDVVLSGGASADFPAGAAFCHPYAAETSPPWRTTGRCNSFAGALGVFPPADTSSSIVVQVLQRKLLSQFASGFLRGTLHFTGPWHSCCSQAINQITGWIWA